MKLYVKKYGDVSENFGSLIQEIVKNVGDGADMPIYTLHLCKNMRDRDNAMSVIEGRLAGTGLGARGSLTRSPASTFSYFNGPETVLVEDGLLEKMKYLEEIEGVVSHEWGHGIDYWKNGILSVSSPIISAVLPTYASGEFRAEMNAINAGYSSGCLASREVSVWNAKKQKETVDFEEFMINLGNMGWKAAFKNNPKVPSGQKERIDALWKELVESKKFAQNRRLLSSREVNEKPAIFASESTLEPFVREKMKEYGLKNGALYL